FFFKFSCKVRNEGIALTDDNHYQILFGERYHLTGKVRIFYEFDSKNYAAITVFNLNKLQDSLMFLLLKYRDKTLTVVRTNSRYIVA
ncbi:hypothetical protein Q6253_29320, partial [Klebsiella quasipneumoniae]|nr:hypothetical protein [Klebsiella quasipneumoniae]